MSTTPLPPPPQFAGRLGPYNYRHGTLATDCQGSHQRQAKGARISSGRWCMFVPARANERTSQLAFRVFAGYAKYAKKYGLGSFPGTRRRGPAAGRGRHPPSRRRSARGGRSEVQSGRGSSHQRAKNGDRLFARWDENYLAEPRAGSAYRVLDKAHASGVWRVWRTCGVLLSHLKQMFNYALPRE